VVKDTPNRCVSNAGPTGRAFTTRNWAERADVFERMAGDKKLYWKSLSQFTAVVVATAWQNNGVSGKPEASDIQNAAADLTGVCVFTACA